VVERAAAVKLVTGKKFVSAESFAGDESLRFAELATIVNE
jgi:hypothetical protein